MEVTSIDGCDLMRYENLASDCGTLFNTADWCDLFGDKLIRYAIYENHREPIGGFCLYREERCGFTIIRDPPFTPACGPFLKIRATNPVAALEARRRALNEMASVLDRQRYALIFLSLDRRIEDALPFYWRKFKVVPNYTYLLDLGFSVEKIRQNMSSVRRNDISKACRDGLTVVRVSDMNTVKKLVLDTFIRQQKKISNQYLDAILFKFANESNSFAFATCWDEIPVACCFVVHDRQTAYYLLGGQRSQERHHGAGALAIFQSILHAQEIGLKTFDFEGSVIPSIEKFFRGFGGKLSPYFTINKAWLPIEVALKVIRREIF